MQKARVTVDTPVSSRHDACGKELVSGFARHVQTTADRAARAYWESRARDWRIAVPLKPAAEDIAWYEASGRFDLDHIPGRRPIAMQKARVTVDTHVSSRHDARRKIG